MSAPDLSALVSARLCHDLISPMGAIGNGLELLQLAGGAGARRARAGQRQPRHGARQAALLPHRLRAGRPAGAAVARRGGADHRRDVPRPLHRRLGRARRRPAAPAGAARLPRDPLPREEPADGRHVRVGARRRAASRLRSTAGAPRRPPRSGRTSPTARRCPSSSPDGVQFALLAPGARRHRPPARGALHRDRGRARDRRASARRWPKPGPEPRHVARGSRRPTRRSPAISSARQVAHHLAPAVRPPARRRGSPCPR